MSLLNPNKQCTERMSADKFINIDLKAAEEDSYCSSISLSSDLVPGSKSGKPIRLQYGLASTVSNTRQEAVAVHYDSAVNVCVATILGC